MYFNSLTFLAFFFTVLVTYTFIPRRGKAFLLLVSSYFFYYSFSWRLSALLFFLTVLTYISALVMERLDGNKRLTILVASLTLSFGTLFYFKYLDFFLLNVGAVWHAVPTHFAAFEAIGLSFIIFQITSYLLDIYYQSVGAERSFIRYALFVAFFPKLLQGPLERTHKFIPQLSKLESPKFENLRSGIILMAWGLFLKIVVADRIGLYYVDPVYANTEAASDFEIFLATILYTPQIYFDFAGYTKIAIGAAMCFGINLSENFNSPLLSTSCTDFWRRWHMTLSSWLRDYLFLPLQMHFRALGIHGIVLATILTFTLAGLWHGAAWGFVVFGVFHGLWLSVELYWKNLCKKKTSLKKLLNNNTGKIIKIVLTYSLVSLAFVFFRAPDLGTSLKILEGFASVLVQFGTPTHEVVLAFGKALSQPRVAAYDEVGFVNFVILALSFLAILSVKLFASRLSLGSIGPLGQWLLAELLFISVVFLGILSSSSFAYFKF